MNTWMKLSEIDKYMDEIVRLKVSVIARAPGGFLSEYRKHHGKHKLVNDYWRNKRTHFIARHLNLYNKDRSYRHYLSLIAWAYKPANKPLNNIK
jgi:hypothetical protein